MSTVTPESPENERRIAFAAAHRTVATIYDTRELPALHWAVDNYAQAYAFTSDQTDLDEYAGWLDDPHRTDHTDERFDHHSVWGTKEGVSIRVSYIVNFETDLPQLAGVAAS